ncbi:MAG TPA: PKD domain-containing protein [Solirubrobacteraceae bacterium]|nr:PKD domain-containing protein [Solirubrobacteraceae bacterium]
MNTLARLHPRPLAARNATKLLTACAAAALTCLAGAVLPAPAGAVVATVGSTTVGVQPPVVGTIEDGPFLRVGNGKPTLDAMPETFEDPGGNPVVHTSNVYLIYWDPTNHYHNDWKAAIDTFLEGVNQSENAFTDVMSVDEQYTDRTNEPAYNRVTYRGSYTDTAPYPPAGCTDPNPLKFDEFSKTEAITCITDQQIREHIPYFIKQWSLPTGMNTIYYVLTPPGVGVCLDEGGEEGHCSSFGASEESYEDSFCSYHGDVNPGGLETGDSATILYGVIPWTAGGVADGQLATEDETEAPYCQDGGFDPSSKPRIERFEEQKEVSSEEEKAFEKMNPQEKEEWLIKYELEGPHIQEPNQKPCPTADGYCDVGLADLIVNQVAVEQQDIVTDPLLHSWQDDAGNEVTDECRNWFAPYVSGTGSANSETGAGTLVNNVIAGHDYYLGESFNYASELLPFPAVPCVTGIRLEPEFNAISPIEPGDNVGFSSADSVITLNAGVNFSNTGEKQANYAKMKWNFGDGSAEVTGYAPGSPPCELPWKAECAESVYHVYKSPGTYTVTLTATDVGGNSATVSHEVTVIGPPAEGSSTPPGPPEGSSGAGSSSPDTTAAGGTTTPATTAGGTTLTGTAVPVPVASAYVVSHSLKTAISKGVAVHYKVNEQVAGHFEVLLGQKLAKHLKIHGRLAGALPAGSEPQVVIGTALVVTLKGGGSTTHVILTKSAAAGLRHAKKVVLGLRLTVRNAAVHNPATAIVMSAFTLKR